MAEFAERSPASVAAPATVTTSTAEKRIHSRQVLHVVITVVLFGFYAWPIGTLVNGLVEPRILGIPFYVFWVLFLIPAVQFINLLLYARFMVDREKQIKAEAPDRAAWE